VASEVTQSKRSQSKNWIASSLTLHAMTAFLAAIDPSSVMAGFIPAMTNRDAFIFA